MVQTLHQLIFLSLKVLLDLVLDQPVDLVPGQAQRIHSIKVDGAVTLLCSEGAGEDGEERQVEGHHDAVTDLWSL